MCHLPGLLPPCSADCRHVPQAPVRAHKRCILDSPPSAGAAVQAPATSARTRDPAGQRRQPDRGDLCLVAPSPRASQAALHAQRPAGCNPQLPLTPGPRPGQQVSKTGQDMKTALPHSLGCC